MFAFTAFVSNTSFQVACKKWVVYFLHQLGRPSWVATTCLLIKVWEHSHNTSMVLFHLVYSFLYTTPTIGKQMVLLGLRLSATFFPSPLTGYDILSIRKRCLLGPLVPLPNASLPLDGLTAFMLPDRWS